MLFNNFAEPQSNTRGRFVQGDGVVMIIQDAEAPDTEACATRCLAAEACLGFSYPHATTHSEDYPCWLFNAQGLADGVVTGKPYTEGNDFYLRLNECRSTTTAATTAVATTPTIPADCKESFTTVSLATPPPPPPPP